MEIVLQSKAIKTLMFYKILPLQIMYKQQQQQPSEMQSGEDDRADEFEQCVCFCCVAYFPSRLV